MTTARILKTAELEPWGIKIKGRERKDRGHEEQDPPRL